MEIKADYIDKNKLTEALNDAKDLVEENQKLKYERDNAYMFLILMFINQDSDTIKLPEFIGHSDLHEYISDRIKVNINIGEGFVVNGEAQGSTAYFSIPTMGRHDYFHKKTVQEVKDKVKQILEDYQNNKIL